jgi:hypothetical protein
MNIEYTISPFLTSLSAELAKKIAKQPVPGQAQVSCPGPPKKQEGHLPFLLFYQFSLK